MPKSENDGSLVLLHYLPREAKAGLERKAQRWGQGCPRAGAMSVLGKPCRGGLSAGVSEWSRLSQPLYPGSWVPLPRREPGPELLAGLERDSIGAAL